MDYTYFVRNGKGIDHDNLLYQSLLHNEPDEEAKRNLELMHSLDEKMKKIK